MRYIVLHAFGVLMCLISAAVSCNTDSDCNLNGVCSGGNCVCDPGWRGAACSALNITTTDFNNGYNDLAAGTTSWGGRAMVDDAGVWHLFYARMVNNCDLSAWSSNSECAHATGPTALGPFVHKDVIVPVFCHNPSITRTADGTYMMWHIGAGNTTSKPENCTASGSDGYGTEVVDPSVIERPRMGAGDITFITYSTSASLSGPWKAMGGRVIEGNPGKWDNIVTNPYAAPQPDGSVLLAFRGKDEQNKELLGLAASSAANGWKGPYERLLNGPLIPQTGEDPCIYRDKRGNFHIVFHDFSSFNGGHTFAANMSGPWTYASGPAYNKTVLWTNGTITTVGRRERPQLIFDATTGYPSVLYTGVTPWPSSSRAFTMASAIHTS